jgi:uncharacterized small protein (DUF1192 family)
MLAVAVEEIIITFLLMLEFHMVESVAEVQERIGALDLELDKDLEHKTQKKVKVIVAEAVVADRTFLTEQMVDLVS